MAEFVVAQAADPFDPAPMLIWADWLEEQGDEEGAAVLRSLAEGGMPRCTRWPSGLRWCP